MPNGKPGDHPYTDIVTHGHDVYSPGAANLVREIAKLSDEKTRRELADLLYSEYNESDGPHVHKLQTALTEMATGFCETPASAVSMCEPVRRMC
jgi:hypothetical protein